MPRLALSYLVITLRAFLALTGVVAIVYIVAFRDSEGGRDCSNASCAEDYTALVATPDGSGSGVLIDPEHVLTAAHVVEGESKVTVTFLNDLTPRRAVNVATSSCDDLAVIQIERTAFTPVSIASKQTKVGDAA